MVIYVPGLRKKSSGVFCLPVISVEVKGFLGMDFGVQIPPNRPKVFWKPRVYVEQKKVLTGWVFSFFDFTSILEEMV